MIIKCDCKNEYQDKLYGKGMRVYTQKFSREKTAIKDEKTGKVNTSKKERYIPCHCTVCGKRYSKI